MSTEGRDHKGRFVKGNSGNPNRGKTPSSQKLRETIRQFIDNNFGAIQEKFDGMNSKDQLTFITQLLPYAIGKVAPIENKEETSQEDKKTFTVEIVEGTSKQNIPEEQKAS